MRIIVMYDLPVADMQDRHEYSRFRQFLVRDGYTRLQNSVYTRLAVDTKNADAAIVRLKANLPEAGLVQVLRVSEISFCSMLTLCGSPSDEGASCYRRGFYRLMIVKLETIGETIDLPDGLGVISFDEFDGLSRCARSLLREGEPGIAIYRGERRLKLKDIVLIDSLIELPFDDRRLTGAYASRMAAEVEAFEPLATKAHEIRTCVDELIAELGASFRTDPIGDSERDIKSFAKWLSLTPRREPGSTLLRRFLSFMDYVCDTGLSPSIAVIGLIDKLNPADVLDIARKARYEGLEMLFLEYREVNAADIEIPVWHIDRDGVLFFRTV